MCEFPAQVFLTPLRREEGEEDQEDQDPVRAGEPEENLQRNHRGRRRGQESCCWIRFLSLERPEQDPVCSTMSARRDQVSLDPSSSDGVVDLD